MKDTSLLMNGPALQVLPSLAVLIGLNEAIALQQLHYWLQRSDKFIRGQYWRHASIDEWKEDFPFWSERTIKRVFDSLKNLGLIKTGRFNKMNLDRTRWYTIDYEKLAEMARKCQVGTFDAPSGQVGTFENHAEVTDFQIETQKTAETPKVPNWPYPSGQFGTFENRTQPHDFDAKNSISRKCQLDPTNNHRETTFPEITGEVARQTPKPLQTFTAPPAPPRAAPAPDHPRPSKTHSQDRGTRLPDDWTLPKDWRQWAEAERPDLNIIKVSACFADYWQSAPGAKGRKTNWLATWRNWVRNESKPAMKKPEYINGHANGARRPGPMANPRPESEKDYAAGATPIEDIPWMAGWEDDARTH